MVPNRCSPAASARRALRFSRALLLMTARDNGDAMNRVVQVFVEVARAMDRIDRGCAARPASAAADAELRDLCASAGARLREGLMALQLQDVTDQRLSHVAALLGDVDDGRDRAIEPLLSDAEERLLLELIDAGASVTEALARVPGVAAAADSVELF